MKGKFVSAIVGLGTAAVFAVPGVASASTATPATHTHAQFGSACWDRPVPPWLRGRDHWIQIGRGWDARCVLVSWGNGFGGGHGGFGGIHGGYGYRGGYGGRYGRWYGGYGYGGWGWPGYGLYLSTLPYGYSTYWWDAVPYYYADSNYYVWDGSVGEYEAVNPPTEVVNQATMQQTGTELFAYPKNGQSAEQQAQDKQECRTWADAQTGYDATQTPTTSSAATMNGAASPTHRQEFLRAQAACLEGRGYSVK